MNSITENALRNLIEAYTNYLNKYSELKLQLPQDLFQQLKEPERERLRRLINEFNAERLQESKEEVSVWAADFCRDFNRHGL